MTQYPCETCKLRAHYDNYFTHQDKATKAAIREKYHFTKYQ